MAGFLRWPNRIRSIVKKVFFGKGGFLVTPSSWTFSGSLIKKRSWEAPYIYQDGKFIRDPFTNSRGTLSSYKNPSFVEHAYGDGYGARLLTTSSNSSNWSTSYNTEKTRYEAMEQNVVEWKGIDNRVLHFNGPGTRYFPITYGVSYSGYFGVGNLFGDKIYRGGRVAVRLNRTIVGASIYKATSGELWYVVVALSGSTTRPDELYMRRVVLYTTTFAFSESARFNPTYYQGLVLAYLTSEDPAAKKDILNNIRHEANKWILVSTVDFDSGHLANVDDYSLPEDRPPWATIYESRSVMTETPVRVAPWFFNPTGNEARTIRDHVLHDGLFRLSAGTSELKLYINHIINVTNLDGGSIKITIPGSKASWSIENEWLSTFTVVRVDTTDIKTVEDTYPPEDLLHDTDMSVNYERTNKSDPLNITYCVAVDYKQDGSVVRAFIQQEEVFRDETKTNTGGGSNDQCIIPAPGADSFSRIPVATYESTLEANPNYYKHTLILPDKSIVIELGDHPRSQTARIAYMGKECCACPTQTLAEVSANNVDHIISGSVNFLDLRHDMIVYTINEKEISVTIEGSGTTSNIVFTGEKEESVLNKVIFSKESVTKTLVTESTFASSSFTPQTGTHYSSVFGFTYPPFTYFPTPVEPGNYVSDNSSYEVQDGWDIYNFVQGETINFLEDGYVVAIADHDDNWIFSMTVGASGTNRQNFWAMSNNGNLHELTQAFKESPPDLGFHFHPAIYIGYG